MRAEDLTKLGIVKVVTHVLERTIVLLKNNERLKNVDSVHRCYPFLNPAHVQKRLGSTVVCTYTCTSLHFSNLNITLKLISRRVA